jgi:hypothetical protein
MWLCATPDGARERNMYYDHSPGKVAEAVGFAHQDAKLVEKITGLKVGVSMPVGGNPFRIAWATAEPNTAR